MKRFVIEVNVPEGTDAGEFASLIEMVLANDLDYPNPDPTVWSSPEDYAQDWAEHNDLRFEPYWDES